MPTNPGKAPEAEDSVFLQNGVILSLLVKSREKEKFISKDIFWVHVSKERMLEQTQKKKRDQKKTSQKKMDSAVRNFH